MQDRTPIKEALQRPEHVGRTITVMGWVRTNRPGKAVSFIELNDGSCLKGLQVVYSGEALPNFEEIGRVLTGACLRVRGTLAPSEGKGQTVELKAEEAELIGPCDGSFPLQKKRHSFEYLRTIAHLRPRTNTFGAVFRVRHQLAFAIHRFFHERGFIWVHTPIITGSDCEGAGEMFRVSTLSPTDPPRTESGEVDWAQDFFGRQTNLTVSGQLSGEMFALALGNIYTFGPTFRAENSNTTRHASEFWMIEPEMAFHDLADDARLAQDFLQFIIAQVLEHCPEDMAFFDQWVKPGIVARLEELTRTSFETIPYTEAVRLLERSGQAFQFPVSWGMDLQTEHERWLTETHVGRPVFVIDYPKEIKAFYMRQNDDGRTVAAMDLLVPGVGEIIGGSQREERHDLLLARIREMGLPEADYWWYLESRRFGSAPHAGFGLGFERAIMYVTGMENIRDVVPFPRTPGNCDF
ncbi:MAG: asparagine--tRNA ligase [bacterium]|jgi:asparaginyl-tRNA synthetase|nr:asparagine--tRNA ligase [bacterium]